MRELANPSATESAAPFGAGRCEDVAGGAEPIPVETGVCMTASYEALVDAASTLIERVMTATKSL